jgi:hypothetical protein
MSNSLSDDYFSFMSNKWEDKHTKQHGRAGAPLPKLLAHADTIDFIEESQFEVTESFVSDTTIQRIFKRFSTG